MNKYRVVQHYYPEIQKALFYMVLRRDDSTRWGGYVKKSGKTLDSTGAGDLLIADFARSKRTAFYGSIDHAIRHIKKFEGDNKFQVEVEYSWVEMDNGKPMEGNVYTIYHDTLFHLEFIKTDGKYINKAGETSASACPPCQLNPNLSTEDMGKDKSTAWYKDLTHAVKSIVKHANNKNFTVNVVGNHW